MDLKDETSLFHNRLVDHYRERVQRLRLEYIDSLPEGEHYNYLHNHLELSVC